MLRAVPAPRGAAPASPRAVCGAARGSHHGCGCWVPAVSPLCHRSVPSRSPLCHRSPPRLRSSPAAPPPVPPPTLPIGCRPCYFRPCPLSIGLCYRRSHANDSHWSFKTEVPPSLLPIGRRSWWSRLPRPPLVAIAAWSRSAVGDWLERPRRAQLIGWGRAGWAGPKSEESQ